MALNAGDLIHIVVRRRFEADLRRHFVGRVVAASDASVRVSGYPFLFNPGRNEWVRRPDRREIVVGLASGDALITVLPPETSVDSLRYAVSAGRLVLTDGAGVEIDINEFGANR